MQQREDAAMGEGEAPQGALLDAGWTTVDGLLVEDEARAVAQACEATLAALGGDVRTGDKPHGGTRHLVDLPERVPEVVPVLADARLRGPVESLVGADPSPGVVAYRCPGPGYGAQRFHADAQPMLEPGPAQVATAIVALTDFTEENGATRVVPGSHLRPDQQRLSGNLEHHPDEVVLTGAAGTAFVFSGHLLHSGTLNRSDSPRPSLQVVFWRRGQEHHLMMGERIA